MSKLNEIGRLQRNVSVTVGAASLCCAHGANRRIFTFCFCCKVKLANSIPKKICLHFYRV